MHYSNINGLVSNAPSQTVANLPTPAEKLDLLWKAQFGNGREVVGRAIGISTGGIGLYVYNGLTLGLIWIALYHAVLFVAYLMLRPRAQTTQGHYALSLVAYYAIRFAYLSLPFWAVMNEDPVFVFCGTCALVAYGAFTLFQTEPPRIATVCDVALGWALLGAIAVWLITSNTSILAQGYMLLLTVILGIYYTLAILAKRASQAELRLANQRNVEAHKMEAIGRLSGGIAHDFNNILTVLQGSLELYHEVPEGAERDALVDQARASGSRAAALVAQLLAFARRAPLETRAHDANTLVNELSVLAHRLLPSSILLDVRTPETTPYVLGDANGLHSALLNLILNANDAMDGRGAIVLAVDIVNGPADSEPGSALRQGQAQTHLRFSVADDGPGMPPEVENRALEPFFTTKPVGKGSGLGLPMALGFAEQSGGALRIATGISGTTVALHLPMSMSAQAADQTASQSAS